MQNAIGPKFLRFNQKIGWIILRPILKFFTDYRACADADCDIKNIKKPVLIVSNHVSYIDPPLIGTVLPINCKAYPVYFITKDKIMAVPVLGGLLKFFGAFSARRGEGLEKSLAEPMEILNRGYSVVFFPEGKRHQIFAMENGRTGAATLALQTNVLVLPVAICGLSPFSWKNFFLRRYYVKINIGQPFLLKNKLAKVFCESNAAVGTQIIMKEIKRLIEQS